MNTNLKIAITGGIGSGKTLFSNIIEEKGYSVVKADLIAKNVLKSHPEVIKQIKQTFGEQSYKSGNPNIKFLAEKVFNKKENVKKINAIVHPVTIKEIIAQMEENCKKQSLAFCESALIFEAGREELFDYIILITAEKELRIKRVQERDKISKKEVLSRMENQISEAEKKSLADFVMKNDTGKEELKEKADFILNLLETLSE